MTVCRLEGWCPALCTTFKSSTSSSQKECWSEDILRTSFSLIQTLRDLAERTEGINPEVVKRSSANRLHLIPCNSGASQASLKRVTCSRCSAAGTPSSTWKNSVSRWMSVSFQLAVERSKLKSENLSLTFRPLRSRNKPLKVATPSVMT